MKLWSLLGFAAFVIGQDETTKTPPLKNIEEKLTSIIAWIEDGNENKPFTCPDATKWNLEKLGNSTNIEELKPIEPESDTSRYELKNNKLIIKANKKDRSMMGIIKATGGNKECKFTVAGKPVFDNLANSLTNLNDDKSKRMDCAVKGYPLPTIQWRFQAIDQDHAAAQCANNVCTPCLDESKCQPTCKDNDPQCEADYYIQNSTGLFDVPNISTQIQVRYSLNEAGACPMGTAEIDESQFGECKIVKSESEISQLDSKLLSRSQLFFSNVQYEQRGKYICVATQTFGKIERKTSDRAKAFIWRVKDPIAALWPFLALVVEVMIVVCIILYYEKASAAKKEAEGDEEGGEFLDKKEDS